MLCLTYRVEKRSYKDSWHHGIASVQLWTGRFLRCLGKVARAMSCGLPVTRRGSREDRAHVSIRNSRNLRHLSFTHSPNRTENSWLVESHRTWKASVYRGGAQQRESGRWGEGILRPGQAVREVRNRSLQGGGARQRQEEAERTGRFGRTGLQVG
jgi:hypothetical protein